MGGQHDSDAVAQVAQAGPNSASAPAELDVRPVEPNFGKKQEAKRQAKREMKKIARREKRSKIRYDAVERVADLFGWEDLGGGCVQQPDKKGAKANSTNKVKVEDLAALQQLPPHEREAAKLAFIREREARKRREPVTEETLEDVRRRVLSYFGFEEGNDRDVTNDVENLHGHGRDSVVKMTPRKQDQLLEERAAHTPETTTKGSRTRSCASGGVRRSRPSSQRSSSSVNELDHEDRSPTATSSKINHKDHAQEIMSAASLSKQAASPQDEQQTVDGCSSASSSSTTAPSRPYTPYRKLPQEFTSASTLDFVERFFSRGEHYSQKFSPQEASLLEQLARLNADGETILIDLGCGNATLVLLASLVFGSYAIGVDRRTPHANCQGEKYFPENKFPELKFSRIERCVSDCLADVVAAILKDFSVEEERSTGHSLEDDLANLKQLFSGSSTSIPELLEDEQAGRGADRARIKRRSSYTKIIVLCKHLCGAGTDYCIRFMEDLAKTGLPLTAAVFATCCTHKISTDPQNKDLPFFLDYYKDQSVALGFETLTSLDEEVAGPQSEQARPFDDGDDVVCEPCEEVGGAAPAVGAPPADGARSRSTGSGRGVFFSPRTRSRFAQLCRWAAWRNTQQSVDSKLGEEHIYVAEVCDDVVQGLRMEKLRTFFREVRQIVYVPLENSMQNRAIVCESTAVAHDLDQEGEYQYHDRLGAACWKSRLVTLLTSVAKRHAPHLPVKLAAHDLYGNAEGM